jgi:hypothetical protein
MSEVTDLNVVRAICEKRAALRSVQRSEEQADIWDVVKSILEYAQSLEAQIDVLTKHVQRHEDELHPLPQSPPA